ncbi:hypothetical protein [uncultured Sphingomonas sp.]|uniref:hypothetical protein n=1 Tax=uncultured Sphingomonas sp. TaxID=158754 RepID=UPI0035CA8A93
MSIDGSGWSGAGISAALLLVALTASCAGSGPPANPIIGEWRIVDGNCNPMSRIIYTPTTYAGYETAAGSFPGWKKLDASYTVSAEEVWMRAGGSNYRIIPLDADHIKPDDLSACIYQRVK